MSGHEARKFNAREAIRQRLSGPLQSEGTALTPVIREERRALTMLRGDETAIEGLFKVQRLRSHISVPEEA